MSSIIVTGQGQSDVLSSSFKAFTSSVEKETKVLKCIANLTSAASSSSSKELVGQLFQIETAVARLEQSLEDYENFLDVELSMLDSSKSLLESAKEQAEEMKTIKKSMDANASTAATAASISSTRPAENEGGLVAVVPAANGLGWVDVSDAEIKNMSRSALGRLTLAQINSSLHIIQGLLSSKSKNLLTIPRKKMSRAMLLTHDAFVSLKCPEHEENMFLSEAEMR